MTNPTKNTNDFISVLKVFVSHGLLDKLEIINWADKEIAKSDNPDDYFIELSLIGTKTTNQITDLLSDFIEKTGTITTGRAIIGLTWDKIKSKAIDYKKGMEVIYSVQGQFPFRDIEKNYISHADDGLDLAIRKIWGEKDEIEKKIEKFLECYGGFTFDNVDNWDQLALETDDTLDIWDKGTKSKVGK
jgi:effector-binding domain-containing protein